MPRPAPRIETISRPHHSYRSFVTRVREGDSYGLLLALIMVTYTTIAVLERSLWERFVVTTLLAGVLLLALHTSHVHRRALHVGIAMAVLAMLIALVQAITDHHGQDGSTYLMFVLILAAPVAILNRISRHRIISTETILGAICVYILIGIAFAGIYAGIHDIERINFFAEHAVPSNIDFLYFSFTVLTTLGFGDLTPGPDVAKLVVTFEALIGQIFLVTLVARLVSLYGTQRTIQEEQLVAELQQELAEERASRDGDAEDEATQPGG